MSSEFLRDKAKKGFIWNTIERLSSNGISFIVTIILARLLSPDDYGIITMPAIFLALAQVLVDSGFANALIRKPNLTEKDLSTSFYFNIIVGLLCYIILYISSPFIANFFNTPILSQLLKITSLVLFINSLGIVPQALMTKRLDFKTQAVIALTSTMLSGIVGIWMAYRGYGVWALVCQQVSSALLRVVLLWLFCHWRPLLIWSNESFSYLWSFGSKVIIIGFLDTIYNNIYAFVIGKFYNAKDLGNYTRALQFADLPISNLNGIIQRVTLPLLSEIQNDHNRLSSIYLNIIRFCAHLIIPIMLGLVAIAQPLIIVLLGYEWSGCVLIFQILCIAKIWTPFNAINMNLLQVKGRTDLQLNLEILKKMVITIILVLTIKRGIIVLVGGYAICTFIAFIINTYYTKRLIGVTLWKQLQVIIPSIIISLIMLFIVLLFNMIDMNMYLKLVANIMLCLIIYGGLVYFFRKNIMKEMISLLKR